jgi:N-acetylglucosaminyldiphosphoundecaprenol N-acetyl-beta-D-mannosaminyltransferase
VIAAAATRVELLGLALDPISEAQTVEAVLAGVRDGRGGWVCPANLDVLRQIAASPEIRALVSPADLVVADGMPLVWASRLLGAPLPERVAGSSLIQTLPRAAAVSGASIFLLGGNPGATEAAARRLRADSPALRIAGTLCPPFGFEDDPAQLGHIEAALLRAAPDVVFVGLGFPKQERLIRHLRPLLARTWFVSCGISLSFAAGEISRAPVWLQRAGLEWAYRLAQEPRRLARRYLVAGPPVAARLLAGAATQRVVGRPR